MLRSFLRNGFARFGRRYGYDTGYLEELADSYPGKATRFSLLAFSSSHYQHVPKEMFFAAKLRSARLADCGPCVGLVAAMAREAGVDDGILKDVLRARPEAIPAQAALAYRFAEAVHDRSGELAELTREIELDYGRRGLWDLSSAVAWGQFYPVLKRGLGRAESCAIVDPDALVEGPARAG